MYMYLYMYIIYWKFALETIIEIISESSCWNLEVILLFEQKDAKNKSVEFWGEVL